MNKQELIALYERVGNFVEAVKVKDVIDKLKQLDEPQKVTIPQFVADWIKYCKNTGVTLVRFSKEINQRNFEEVKNEICKVYTQVF